MSQKITTVKFAEEVNVTPTRVRQMILEGTLPAEKLGRDWLIEDKFIRVIKNRPETRGRKPLKKAA